MAAVLPPNRHKGVLDGFEKEPCPAGSARDDYRWMMKIVLDSPAPEKPVRGAAESDAEIELRTKAWKEDLVTWKRQIRRTCQRLMALIQAGEGIIEAVDDFRVQLGKYGTDMHPLALSALRLNLNLVLTTADAATQRTAMTALTKATVDKPLKAPEKAKAMEGLSVGKKMVERPAPPTGDSR